MITTADFSKGKRILLNGEPVTIVEVTTQSPSARGASTLVKIKARSMISRRMVNETIKAGSKFEEPDIRTAPIQYLYSDGSGCIFMDQTSYEQFTVDKKNLEPVLKYLHEELEVSVVYFNDEVVDVKIPDSVILKVVTVEPGTRGNTASGSVTTPAELDNGMTIGVPLFIKEGQMIKVDTRTDSFMEKA